MEVKIKGKKGSEKVEHDDFSYNPIILEQTKGSQRRKNMKDKATHVLAYSIVGIFLFIALVQVFKLCSIEIPEYMISIVSIVIGFYFGNKAAS